MTKQYAAVRDAIREGRSVATATLVAGPGRVGGKLVIWPGDVSEGELGLAALEARVRADVPPMLERGETRLLEYPEFGAAVFVESFVPPPGLFMVGGVHIAVALAALAKVVGFRTVVVDARAAFATEERFAHVDELVVAWPDEALEGRLDARSCVAVLTHDPKLDDPALRVALRSPARYVGALGSPTTHQKRLERLRAEGFAEAELARIHGPIGLTIGARTPEEIAVSILAQIIQAQRGA
ncbi:MAG TPA: XdhC/CoxI family protein [Chloroflexaceae bacterium]|nr:XdhC/CoxI family protein [Chloroflexaceae bacterium]